MTRARTTVGFVQIGEVTWERRPSQQYRVVDGMLWPKPQGPRGTKASFAYLPQSVGMLEAYARKHAAAPDVYAFLPPIYSRLPVEKAVGLLDGADVVGFSTYIWNVRRSLRIAEALKRQRPETLIVFGGPQVPDLAEDFLRAHPFIDLACHGEGERTFLEVLEHGHDRRWGRVDSVSFIDPSGRFIRNPCRPRIPDLDEIPSPLLEGLYDDLMRSNPEQDWLLTWETNRGCPFSCAFCDWGSATGSKVNRFGMERLVQEIEWMADHGIHHLFVCDANFGMLPRDVEITRRLADVYARRGSYLAISVQNTKNRTERSEEIQRIFQDSRVISFGASISLQSVDPTVLKAVRRNNISQEAFARLQRNYARDGLETYTDLIIGLPEETYDSFAAGVDYVIRDGQLNRITFYECSILPNAPMADPAYRKTYGLETVPVRIVHAHEPLDHGAPDEAAEMLDIIIATRALSRDDWVRVRVYADFVELLYYDRLLHVVMVVLGEGVGLSYRRMFEAFLGAGPSEFPVVAAVRRAFEERARAMQGGGPQYVPAPEWLNLWWPASQHALLRLVHHGLLDTFYHESSAILAHCAAEAGVALDPTLLDDAVRLNRSMLALPFQWTDEVLELAYPVAEAYQAVLKGQAPDLGPRQVTVVVERTGSVWMTWDDWYGDLVRRYFLRKECLYPVLQKT